MISPNLSETGPAGPRIPHSFYKGPPSPDADKTDRVAAMNKITNFSIAAIMNSRGRKSEDEDDFEAKRRKLAEAVPALGKLITIICEPSEMFKKVTIWFKFIFAIQFAKLLMLATLANSFF